MLLAVPVGVAAVIGFSDGLGGIVRGFDALDGPEPQARASVASGRALDRALVSLAGPDAPAAAAAGAQSVGTAPGGESPGTAPGEAPAGLGVDSAPAPSPAPSPAPVAPGLDQGTSGTVGSLVDDVNQSVNGLIGAQP